MKEKWLQMAQNANFKAYNNLCGLSGTDEISMKYFNEKSLQAAKFFDIASYCLKRYANSK